MFISYIEERFGITLPEWIDVEERGKVRLFVKKPFNFLGVEVFNRGLNAGKKMGDSYKPSSAFLQLFGFMATRNVVFLEREEAYAFMKGQSVSRFRAYATDGYVAVFYKGRCIGCGLLSKGKLMSQIPKWRRI